MANEIDKLPVRTPEEILQAMDVEGKRENPILMKQLNAELLVSLSIEADKVSKRNLKIATISCVVASASRVGTAHHLNSKQPIHEPWHQRL